MSRERFFYWVALPVVVENCHRQACAGGSLDIKVWAENPSDAIARVEEALSSLVDAELDGDIARIPRSE